ncbi:MAG TPA: matrixin family metalloprotease [Vicinamibacterales bacterium]
MRILAIAVIVCVLVPREARGYLQLSFTARGQTLTLKWNRTPVRWFATDRGVPGVPASAFQATVARAFATWEAVPTASISFQFVGFTGAEPFEDDDLSVLGFQNEPAMDRVLGATGFVIDTLTGEIVESDVFFNSTFTWSTVDAGDPLRFDLESVALHEIGHFLGLSHSALGETEPRPDGGRRVLGTAAVMFPIAFGRGSTQDRALQPDDIAGVSDLYPAGDFRQRTGVVRGRVVRGGAGILGAHVITFNPETGELIGGFSVNREGDFQIGGLSPGPHVIRVEPLDDADVESFFGRSDPVDVNFGVTFHDRLLVAPAGGAGERFTVTVRPK